MKKITLIFCIIIIMTMFCACNEKLMIEDTNVVDDLNSKTQLILNEYYNKYENKTFNVDDVKQKMYVKVASGLKSAYSVSFGSIDYQNKEKVKFNIGKNSYIYTTAYYKKGDSLYVFAPLLAMEGGFSKVLLFCVDGLYFSVQVYDGEYENLTLSTVLSLPSDSNQVALIDKNIANRNVVTHRVSTLETSLGVNFKINGSNLSPNSIIFVRKSYQNYSDPTEYLIYQKNDEYDLKLIHNDSKQELKKGEKRNIDIACTLFGGGGIGFDLDIEHF